MENEIKLFENKEFGKVRIVLENDLPYFNLKDVCKILGLGNSSQVKMRLNTKGVILNDTLTNGGKQKMNFINESNLYKCIFQSKKDEAEKFTEWVTSEVLPSIRKYGEYKLKNEIENLKVRNNELQRQIKYVYTEDEVSKKNEINHLVRKNFNGNIVGAYINLYKLFEETYGINLKYECDKYNEDKEKRLRVNIIQYCLITGHINQLYECCKILYN
jgi:prophage antirepressor-like protein